MCLFLTIFRGKCPFFWDLRTCKTPPSAEFRGIRAEFGQRLAHFSNIGHFFIILQQKSSFKFFFGHFGLFQPKFPNPPPNDKKKAKSAHRRQSKKRHFLAVECQKTQTKMRTNTENHQVCVFPPASHCMEQVEWFRHLDMTSQRAEPLTWALLWIGWKNSEDEGGQKHVNGDPSNEVV